MAAAYLFHITQDHPFVDGNKRTGLVTALVFLALNDRHVEADGGELTELVLGVAAGRVSKAEVAVFFQRNAPATTSSRGTPSKRASRLRRP